MTRRRKIVAGAALGAVALIAGIYTLAAPTWDVPQTLHYEGVLVDDAGSPVTGTVTLYFRIFDAETGGTKLWEEQRGSHSMLPGGVLDVALGERNSIPSPVLQGSRWLEVQVGEDAPLSPRFKIHAVPYARRAGESARVADGADLDGAKIGGTTVTDVIAGLQAQIAAQGARIATLEGDRDCPPGYTAVAGVCTKGADEMVKVGDFWIDRYEAVVVDAAYWNGGQCNGTGTLYGSTSDNWPAVTSFPFTGNWTAKLYSCSKAGVTPSRWMTWFQAQQALSISGKHICTNAEWQAAAAGTPDDAAKCNINMSGPRATSASSQCASKWGAQDMIGNLWEWVDMWGQAGEVITSYTDGSYRDAWDGFAIPDGDDGTWNVNGEAVGCDSNGSTCVWKTGLPFAALRGGNWDNGALAGVFSLILSHAPSYRSNNLGLRGCRR